MSGPEDEMEDEHGECAHEIARLMKERDSLLAVVGACEAIGVARQLEPGRWEVHNARAIEAEGERDAALEWQRIAEADRDRVTDRFVAVEKERDTNAAQLAQAREALSTVLGIGHSLRAFAGTMLRWNEPGVDFTDEAARIVALAEKFHATISAALSTPAPRVLTVGQVEEVVARVFDRTTTAWPLQTTITSVIDEVLNGR